MAKFLLIVLIATIAGAIGSRNIRSPGGSGWQGSNSLGDESAYNGARSSVTTWFDYGNGLGRSSDGASNGWRATRSGGFGGDGGAYSRKSYSNNYDGSNGISSRPNDDSSYSGGWGNPRQSYDSNNGWQSSSW